MSDDPVIELIRRALEAQAAGETVDLETVCAEYPELIPVVRSSLALDGEIRATVGGDPLLSTTLAERYQLNSWLGSGAMGVVYSARDLSLDRDVAVKVLQQGVFASDARRTRFLREARVLAAMQHDHVVRVHDHGVSTSGYHFIVMDQIDGEPLAFHLRSESDAVGTPSFDWIPKAVNWCAQIASALTTAHLAGVLHRDVKPSNILINTEERAILVDFGIAARTGDASLTADGSTLGTPCYMSPEQAEDASSVDEKVDVYGLAATLYHLATFRPPFDGGYHSVVQKLRGSEPTPPGKVQRTLPRDLCAIIEKGMHRDPRRRYPSMEAFERDLRAFLVHRPVAARPVSFLERRWREVKRQKWAVGAAVLVVLAIAVTAKIAVDRERHAKKMATATAEEYRQIHASIPPNLGFERVPGARESLDQAERAGQIARLRRMVALKPGDRFYRMLLVELLLDHGEHVSSAAEFASMVAAEEQEESPFLLGLGSRYEQANREERSTFAVDWNGLPPPSTSLGYFVAAFRAARARKRDEAWAHLKNIADEPAAGDLELGLLLIRARTRRDSDQFELLLARVARRVRETGYQTARSLYLKGAAHTGLRDSEAARDALIESSLMAESFSTLFNLGLAYRRLRRFEKAELALRRAIEIRPRNGNAYLELAVVLSRSNEVPEAQEVLRQVPKGAFLFKEWQRNYYSGIVSLVSAYWLWDDGQHDESEAVTKQSIEAFDAALGLASGDGAVRLIQTDKYIAVKFLRGEASAVSGLVQRIKIDPLDLVRIRALSVVLQKSSKPGSTLRAVAEALSAIDHALRK